MKICSKCKISKPLSEFYKDKTNNDGLYSSCKLCKKTSAVALYHGPTGYKYKERAKRWRRDNRNKHLLTLFKCKLKRDYNITYNQYMEILASQNNVCAICNKPCPTGNRLSIDHCHSTGKIRGLLCTKCNPGLGYFSDDISLLYKAADYLRKFQDLRNNNT